MSGLKLEELVDVLAFVKTEILELEQTLFGHDGLSEKQLEEISQHTDQFFNVLRLDNTVVGYLYAVHVIANGSSDLIKIAVHPQYQGKGYGRFLLKELESMLPKEIDQIILEVRPSNTPAIALYEAAGYERIGMRKNFYQFPKEDANIYQKWLKK